MRVRRSGPAGAALLAILIGSVGAPFVESALAQEGAFVVEAGAGWTGFVDDARIDSPTVTVAGRYHVTPRLSVGPEFVYFHGNRRRHLALTGNLTFDLLEQSSALSRRVMPFVVAGAGLFQTREDFPNETFTSGEGAFTAGGGLRFPVSERVTVGVDARIGWELHLRINGVIGLRLSD